MDEMHLELAAPEDTEALGRALAEAVSGRSETARRRGLLIGLSGPLGAGKTSLVRAMLRSLGVEGAVRSPTYTLVEPYTTALGEIRHLDLYRLGDAGELEHLGVADLRVEAALSLIEWPEQGGRLEDELDLRVRLDYLDGGGRQARLQPRNDAGGGLLSTLRL